MIEIEQLTDADVGRRVVWTVAPGVENRGQLAAWTEDRLVLAIEVAGQVYMHIAYGVDPAEVCWLEVNRRGASARRA
ncbi:MAG: hypothetical protein DMF64_19015 [Acidobacteria bacterium]|nr:MAG: hypothetical protein DMF64_19015 [Acidobacteriota bacterium]